MYLKHWNLARPAFESQPDSRYLFATPQHEEALAAITYGACAAGEPVLLTGLPGCGKTLLLRALRRQLPRDRYHVAFVPEAGCVEVGLLRRVAYHLAHQTPADSSAAMDLILEQASLVPDDGGTVVMLDDWPQNPTAASLAELRWLLNVDAEGERVCVLLSAEEVVPERDWPGWLNHRLFTTAYLGPLDAGQVEGYLTHRLLIAAQTGPARESPIFAPEAAQAIAAWSRGVPRLINRLAHLALHVGALELATVVSAELVGRAAARLNTAGMSGQSSVSPPTAALAWSAGGR
jgi:MSHA biogenesis protein MshM